MAATAAHYTPRTKVRLLGFLRKKYFKTQSFLLGRGDTKEAVKAIDVNYPGFAKDVADAESRGLRFAIFKNGKNIGEDELGLGGARELWFVPVIHGSKRAGVLQTIIGAVLIIASFFVAPGAQAGVLAAGVGSTAGGIIQMLSPQLAGLKTSAAPENTPSYAFGSAKNTTASGNPVPLCLGRRRWGGAIISAGIYAEDQM